MGKAAKLLFANFARHMFHARSAGSFDQDLAAVVTKNKDYEINQSYYTILLSQILHRFINILRKPNNVMEVYSQILRVSDREAGMAPKLAYFYL